VFEFCVRLFDCCCCGSSYCSSSGLGSGGLVAKIWKGRKSKKTELQRAWHLLFHKRHLLYEKRKISVFVGYFGLGLRSHFESSNFQHVLPSIDHGES